MTIDVHTHVVPRDLDSGHADWPGMRGEPDGSVTMYVAGTPYRRLDARSWDTVARIAVMDEEGVRVQALSPMPELFAYWHEVGSARALAQRINEQIGDMVATRSDRFVGLGTLTLQDEHTALRQIEWLAGAGFAGVEVGTHVDGISLADEKFNAIFAALELARLCVLIHSVRPRGFESGGAVVGLEMLVGYPLDTARTFAEMLGSRFRERHPRLRVGFCHCGGASTLILPRLKRGAAMAPHIAEYFGDLNVAARSYYYDSLLFDNDLLRYAINTFGSDRIMVGSDFPYPIYARRPSAFINELALDPQTARRIAEDNAAEFLGLAG